MKHKIVKIIMTMISIGVTGLAMTNASADTPWDEKFSGTYDTQCQNGSYAAMFALQVNGIPIGGFPISIPAQCEDGIGLLPSDEWVQDRIVLPLVELCDSISKRRAKVEENVLLDFLQSCQDNADFIGRQFQLSVNQLSPQPWNGFYTNWNGLYWNWFGKKIYSSLPVTDTIRVLEDGGNISRQSMILDWAHSQKSVGGLKFNFDKTTREVLGAEVICSSVISGITTQDFDDAHVNTLVSVRTNHLAIGSCRLEPPEMYRIIGLRSATISVSASTETYMRGNRIDNNDVLESLKAQPDHDS